MKNKIETILFDLDGTIYTKGKPIKTAADTLNQLRKSGYKLGFITNTNGSPVSLIHSKLLKMGFDIALEEVFTPITAIKEFFLCNPGKSCYCLTTDEVLNDLKELNMNNENPDYVVIASFSQKVSYDEINKVFRFIMNGASILAASKTMYFFHENGININVGAFVSMFENACNKEALLLGKPSKEFYSLALSRLKSKAESTLVVGDDITVDVIGAKSINAASILVKTGHYTDELLDMSPDKPDYIIEDITHLPEILNSNF